MALETRDGIVKKKNKFRVELNGVYPQGTLCMRNFSR